MPLNVAGDALSWVRSHPERFFAGGVPTEFELARMTWMDAVLSGADQVATIHTDPFWVIAASTDWLMGAGLPIDDLFRRLMPLVGAGPNSARSEVVLNAFCSEIGAVSQGTITIVRGGNRIADVLQRGLASQGGLVAAIAYCLAPSSEA